MKQQKYQYIDSLRGIAILLVILVHVGYMYNETILHYYPNFLYKFIRNGQLGVQLFFIVSALTLTMSWYSRLEESHKIIKFFIRRFFRIAPLFYLAIIYFTFEKFLNFNLTTFNFSEIPRKGIIYSFLFINGFFPKYINSIVPGGWSITIEFMFYSITPLILSKIKNINKSIQFVSVCLIITYFLNKYIIGYFTNNEEFLYYNIVSQLPIFLLGILCYWIIKFDKTKDYISRTSLICIISVIFLFCYEPIPYHFLYSLIFVLLIVIQSYFPVQLFSNQVLARIGQLSFSMYLVHFAIIYFLNRMEWTQHLYVSSKLTSYLTVIITYITVFVGTFFISHFTYKFIEIPGQNFGKKIIKNLDKSK